MFYNSTHRTDGIPSDNLIFLGVKRITSIRMDELHGTNLNLFWPTGLGKTKIQAEEHCRSVLRSSTIYVRCAGKFDEAGLISQCTLDVQVVGLFIILLYY